MQVQARLTSTPAEVRRLILAQLSKNDLLRLRLVDRALARDATDMALSHFRLGAGSIASASGLANISRAAHMSQELREITLDTDISTEEVSFKYGQEAPYRLPETFIKSLTHLTHLTSLETLNIRFNDRAASEHLRAFMEIEETHDIRFHVLNTVFQALHGSWTEDMWDAVAADLKYKTSDASAEAQSPTKPAKDRGAIQLKSLTVDNLAAFNDKRLTESQAFNAVLSSPSLTSLKLMVTMATDERGPYNEWLDFEKVDFFEALPSTWLAPSVAQNLRTLSLYATEYWGWYPKFDPRVLANDNPGGGFPNLRVLALGNLVFTNTWQLNWIASLGRDTDGKGGLQELYLDDCVVMFQATCPGPLDAEDYPKKETQLDYSDYATLKKSHRWHHILTHWAKSPLAKSLRVFKMGSGDWDGHWKRCMRFWRYKLRTEGHSTIDPVGDVPVFLAYDQPPLPSKKELHNTATTADELLRAYPRGYGMSQDPDDRFQYRWCCSGMAPNWLDTNEEDEEDWDYEYHDEYGWEPETRRLDEEAYEKFLALVDENRMRESPLE